MAFAKCKHALCWAHTYGDSAWNIDRRQPTGKPRPVRGDPQAVRLPSNESGPGPKSSRLVASRRRANPEKRFQGSSSSTSSDLVWISKTTTTTSTRTKVSHGTFRLSLSAGGASENSPGRKPWDQEANGSSPARGGRRPPCAVLFQFARRLRRSWLGRTRLDPECLGVPVAAACANSPSQGEKWEGVEAVLTNTSKKARTSSRVVREAGCRLDRRAGSTPHIFRRALSAGGAAENSPGREPWVSEANGLSPDRGGRKPPSVLSPQTGLISLRMRNPGLTTWATVWRLSEAERRIQHVKTWGRHLVCRFTGHLSPIVRSPLAATVANLSAGILTPRRLVHGHEQTP